LEALSLMESSSMDMVGEVLDASIGL
jgi:hypothetical protein